MKKSVIAANLLLAMVLPLSFASCANASGSKAAGENSSAAAVPSPVQESAPRRKVNVTRYKVHVVKEYPHDVTSYTQGLFFYGGDMFESTGLNGKSTFRKVDIETGEPLVRINFEKKYFVEGSVEKDGKIYVLTWQNNLLFVYDAATLDYEAAYSYPREGWGLTTDGRNLIASDGTANLFFLDDNLRTVRTVPVTMNGRPVYDLNELEYIDGKVWANVYLTDMIVMIDPADGVVTGVVDCSGLLPDSLRTEDTDVLNGIARNPADGKLYLTGKNWCRLYEVELEEAR